MSTATPKSKTLCFLEAFQEKSKGNITEEEYCHHLLAHAAGPLHPRDSKFYPGRYKDVELRDTDLFGYAVQLWAKKVKGSDITPYETVFRTYLRRAANTGTANNDKNENENDDEATVQAVAAALDAISDKLSRLETRRLLAFRALRDRRADILRLCLSNRWYSTTASTSSSGSGPGWNSFSIEGFWSEEAERACARGGADCPETFRVVEESGFRRWHCRLEPGEEMPPWRGPGEDPRIRAARETDVGGSWPVPW